MNNDYIIKGKIQPILNDALKQILKHQNKTQQDFIDLMVKDYVLKYLNLVIKKENTSDKK